MLHVLKKISEKLEAAQIPYIISGSLAVNVYTTTQVYESDRQILDITNLLEVSELDRNYLQYWVKILQLKTFDLPL